MLRQIKKPAIHATDSLPVVSLALPKQVAKPVSNSPATISIIQYTLLLVKYGVLRKVDHNGIVAALFC